MPGWRQIVEGGGRRAEGRPGEERCDRVAVVYVGGLGRRVQGVRRAPGLRGWQSLKVEGKGKERRRGEGGGRERRLITSAD